MLDSEACFHSENVTVAKIVWRQLLFIEGKLVIGFWATVYAL